MQLFPYTSPTMIGLDLGEQSLKIAVLRAKTTWRGKQEISMTILKEYPVPNGAIDHGELRDDDALIKLLQSIRTNLSAQGQKTNEVVLGIPEGQSFMLTQPASQSLEEMGTLITKEIPFTIDELYYDSQLAPPYRMIGAAPKKYIDHCIHIAESAGFTVAGLDLEGLATVRSVVRALPEATKQTWGLIDFGATRTQCMMVDQEIILSSLRLPVAGATLTTSIEETLHLSHEQAEKTKWECGIDPARCTGSLRELLQPHYTLLAARVQEAMHGNDHTSAFIPSIIALVGGGANMPGVKTFLEEALHIPIVIPDLTLPFHQSKNIEILKNSLGFATAIGLALRGLLV